MKTRTLLGFATLALAGAAMIGTNASADPTQGPSAHCSLVTGDSSRIYWLDVNGNELTLIKLTGDGTSDLDLFVYDEYGNLLAHDDSYDDRESVLINPWRTTRIRIEVRNLGIWGNSYCLEAF